MKALLKDNTVIQLDDKGFTVHPSLVWMDAPEGCQTGWVLIDGILQPKPEEPKTIEQLLQEYKDALKVLLVKKAREKDYESDLTIVTYALSTNETWKQEATDFIEWRDKVLIYAYDILVKVESQEIEIPSIDDFISNAPILTWN